MNQDKLKVLLDHYGLGRYYSHLKSYEIKTIEDFSTLQPRILEMMGLSPQGSDYSKLLELSKQTAVILNEKNAKKANIASQESRSSSTEIQTVKAVNSNMPEQQAERSKASWIIIILLACLLCFFIMKEVGIFNSIKENIQADKTASNLMKWSEQDNSTEAREAALRHIKRLYANFSDTITITSTQKLGIMYYVNFNIKSKEENGKYYYKYGQVTLRQVSDYSFSVEESKITY